jgi:lysophospholipase L1-like esterase
MGRDSAVTKKTKAFLLAAFFIVLIVSVTYTTLFWERFQKQSELQPLINVACVGDSITEWSGYTNNLQLMLGEDYKVGNFGVAEAAVSKDWFKPYMNQEAFRDSQDFQPDFVIVMLGTNDAHTYQTNEDFANDYVDLVTEYQSLVSSPRVLLVMPPPIYQNELELSGANLEDDVIPSIEQVAEDLSLPTVDVNSALENHPEYFIDGVHPNSDGAMVIAQEINEAINEYPM